MKQTVTSRYEPKSKNVTWIDMSSGSPVQKNYINGKWVTVGGGKGGERGDVELKTINGNSLKGTGNIAITTYQAFPEAWKDYTTSSYTTKQFCDVIDADGTAVIGMGYFGGASWSDKPQGLANGDVVVEILQGPNNSKAIHLIMTSSSVYPYKWEYTYWSHGSVSGWRGVQPELYRHKINIDATFISVILPYSDTIANHKSALNLGVTGIILDSNNEPDKTGLIFWNYDEWSIMDAAGTELSYSSSCVDTITTLA